MFSDQVLDLDLDAESARIEASIREIVGERLRRRGAVVGISGGIDSALVTALCARALGPQRVLGLLMPERDSSPESARLGRLVAESQGVRVETVDLEPALDAM